MSAMSASSPPAGLMPLSLIAEHKSSVPGVQPHQRTPEKMNQPQQPQNALQQPLPQVAQPIGVKLPPSVANGMEGPPAPVPYPHQPQDSGFSSANTETPSAALPPLPQHPNLPSGCKGENAGSSLPDHASVPEEKNGSQAADGPLPAVEAPLPDIRLSLAPGLTITPVGVPSSQPSLPAVVPPSTAPFEPPQPSTAPVATVASTHPASTPEDAGSANIVVRPVEHQEAKPTPPEPVVDKPAAIPTESADCKSTPQAASPAPTSLVPPLIIKDTAQASSPAAKSSTEPTPSPATPQTTPAPTTPQAAPVPAAPAPATPQTTPAPAMPQTAPIPATTPTAPTSATPQSAPAPAALQSSPTTPQTAASPAQPLPAPKTSAPVVPPKEHKSLPKEHKSPPKERKSPTPAPEAAAPPQPSPSPACSAPATVTQGSSVAPIPQTPLPPATEQTAPVPEKKPRRTPKPKPSADEPIKTPAKEPSTPSDKDGDGKPRRKRLPTQPYQSPIPELNLIAKINKIDKTPTRTQEERLIIFYRNEFLAVRNAEGSYYVCQAMQNIYKSSSRIKIRWLSQDPNGGNYTPDFYDHTEFDCILTNLNLQRVGKDQFKLPEVEAKRTDSILKRAIDVEKGIVVAGESTITEEHPDGLDLSLYRDEGQLKKRKKKSKTAPKDQQPESPKPESRPTRPNKRSKTVKSTPEPSKKVVNRKEPLVKRKSPGSAATPKRATPAPSAAKKAVPTSTTTTPSVQTKKELVKKDGVTPSAKSAVGVKRKAVNTPASAPPLDKRSKRDPTSKTKSATAGVNASGATPAAKTPTSTPRRPTRNSK